MTETVRVKPAPDLKVRFEDPAQGHIPAKGESVPLTPYYYALLEDGDLVRADKPAPAASEAGKRGGK